MEKIDLPEIRLKKDLLAFLRTQYFSDPAKGVLLDHSVFGNAFFAVLMRPDGQRYITVLKMIYRNSYWAIQEMHEQTMPRYLDCPERLLRQSDDTSTTAKEWRQACRSYRREKCADRYALAALKSRTSIGDHIDVVVGYTPQNTPICETVVFHGDYTPNTFIGSRFGERRRKRFHWRMAKALTPDAQNTPPERG